MIKIKTDFPEENIVNRIEKAVKSCTSPAQMKTARKLIEQANKMDLIGETNLRMIRETWELKADEIDQI